ncbi:MAG: 16S rRNA (guanine(966)-N(2))-methyltransferase RsmD [Chloroflexi bacterium]|nr:16S rRNA (guanine(966)-N(2))-methyltransferase RsmD [Chloroflexota bacterium]
MSTSNLRIIAGTARGRKLRSVPGDITRPITDRVKESLFDIIGPDIRDATLLDLFAGSGSVGIEALSRGAAFVRFVDRHRMAIKTLRANLEHTGFTKGVEVLQMDAFALLEREADREFDYVYIAPPQYKGMWKRALLSIDAHPEGLVEDAWVIVQIHPVEFDPIELKNLVEFDQRRYGSTLLIFYIRSL